MPRLVARTAAFRRLSRILVLALAAPVLGFLSPALSPAPAQAAGATGNVTAFTVTGITDPIGVAAGPTSTVWFTNDPSALGSIDASTGAGLQVTTTAGTNQGIVLGSDGNLWFTQRSQNQIGVEKPDGTHDKALSIPTAASAPTAITRATDGKIWFTEGISATARIGQVPSTAATATVDFPVTGSTAGSTPNGIAPGANGSVWFTMDNPTNPQVGQMDASGNVTHLFTVTGTTLGLSGIVVGSDGAVYFGEASGHKVIKMDATTGAMTTISNTGTTTAPESFTLGADGNIWFTDADTGGSSFGRITPAGAYMKFSAGVAATAFSAVSPPVGIASGPDGEIWATSQGTTQLLRLEVQPTGSLGPSTLSFGNQLIATTSTAQTATFNITGGGAATITATSASGSFAITGGTCTAGALVPAGGNCTVQVAFAPTAAGAATGTLAVTATAGGGPFSVALSGTGTTTSGGAPVTTSVVPPVTNFFNQAIGTTSTMHVIALVNGQTTTMTVASLTVTGTASDFPIAPGSDHCTGATVAPQSFCTVGVVFAPTAEGVRVGIISFTDSAAGSPHSGLLVGRGVHAAGYWLVASDGGIFSFPSSIGFFGSAGSIKLNQPIVGMAATPDSQGYWLDATDGGIFAYGDAKFFGSTGSIKLNKPMVGMAPTPTGNGYWLVASDGGIFAFGDAKFFGSAGSIKLNKPIVGMAATQDGQGYWLVATDGGIFAYGDAQFHGSTGSLTLNKPIVGMAATPDGSGYWLDASDGGIFAFSAPFHGSAGSIKLNKPMVGMAPTPTGNGYWLVATDGGIFSYGDAPFFGSTGSIVLNKPIVGMAPAL